jgi:hypothetical protein
MEFFIQNTHGGSVPLRWLGPVAVICLVIACYEIGTQHHKQLPPAPAKIVKPAAAPTPEPVKAEDEYLGQVKVVGPLANWMREAEENSKTGDAQQETPPPAYQASELDRVIRRPTSVPNNFLHTTFPLSTYAAFEIKLPPGMISASLSGSFEAFTYKAGQGRQPADIEVLLLDDAGFTDFVHQAGGSPVYSLEPCSRRSLKWLLNSDYHNIKKYYFVFQNQDTRRTSPSVEADFTLRFN